MATQSPSLNKQTTPPTVPAINSGKAVTSTVPIQTFVEGYGSPYAQYTIPQYVTSVQPQYATTYIQQPVQTVQAVPVQVQTVQIPKTTVVHETHEVKQVRPKVTYTSQYIKVPQTVQVPEKIKQKEITYVDQTIYETKLIPIQVPRVIKVPKEIEVEKEIQVPKTNYVEREIKVPQPVMEKKTVKVPRQRIVTEEEEHTYEVPAVEEYTQTVQVPRVVTTVQQQVVPQTYVQSSEIQGQYVYDSSAIRYGGEYGVIGGANVLSSNVISGPSLYSYGQPAGVTYIQGPPPQTKPQEKSS